FEHSLLRVALKQKQELKDGAAPFQLPLTLRAVVGERVHDVEVIFDEAQQVFVIPLDDEPSQVIVDPGNHVLKTLDEKRPDEWWHAQLREAAHAIDRV